MTSNGSDSPYVSEYPPNCNIDPDIKALIAHYYEQVDTQGKHVEYSECWAEDGVLIIPAGKEFRGREAIKNLHHGMWNGVPRRLHRPKKVFPFSDNSNEVVIVGTVEYWPDDGENKTQDMAARAKYQKNAKTGKTEMSSLQVWLTG
ncbi:hypothetical protein K458DRAFT_439708 [Lentithecium fluviatile CBS 122367]|uniref:Uncharacterized protein n=1 Tax=Lentithecium fluviatile CBS 122367 TaxID=1168545 RepID=A0A6G1JGW4_9PLEO|nr:hypothetical protein K458DRAFT_439708 [Lentithecium fluviatile CBS 122367]